MLFVFVVFVLFVSFVFVCACVGAAVPWVWLFVAFVAVVFVAYDFVVVFVGPCFSSFSLFLYVSVHALSSFSWVRASRRFRCCYVVVCFFVVVDMGRTFRRVRRVRRVRRFRVCCLRDVVGSAIFVTWAAGRCGEGGRAVWEGPSWISGRKARTCLGRRQ